MVSQHLAADAVVTAERGHRVKVQMHFQRGQSPNAGNGPTAFGTDTQGNAPGDERSGTWVRVGGPAITWLRDTRDSVLDAHRGTYTSFQEFLSDKLFGAQVQFNRLDISNSSYYSFDKGRIVLARNTRYGQERAFGTSATQLIPLPERLYAGGATSLRGFSINAAGPRDPETGYPIGGAGALINSTELRLPPPVLPFFGDALSFVVFHDMGNVFASASAAWESALRVRQPGASASSTRSSAAMRPSMRCADCQSSPSVRSSSPESRRVERHCVT